MDEIKAKQEELQKDFYAVSTKLYEQAAQQQGQAGPGPEAAAGGASAPNDNVVDADYTEVDNDNQ